MAHKDDVRSAKAGATTGDTSKRPLVMEARKKITKQLYCCNEQKVKANAQDLQDSLYNKHTCSNK